jgi:hypothetical protein
MIPALAASKLQTTEKRDAGAKAQRLLSAICGTTKVMPCYKTGPSSSFSAACEVVP